MDARSEAIGMQRGSGYSTMEPPFGNLLRPVSAAYNQATAILGSSVVQGEEALSLLSKTDPWGSVAGPRRYEPPDGQSTIRPGRASIRAAMTRHTECGIRYLSRPETSMVGMVRRPGGHG